MINKIILLILTILFGTLKSQTSYYGTSAGGGVNQGGTIFKTDSTGNNLSLIYDFNSGNTPANIINCGLTNISGVIYGLSESGGKYGYGCIYKINEPQGIIEVVYNFSISAGYPKGELVLASNGLSYGILTTGGLNGNGALFSFNPITNIVTTVFDFTITDQVPQGIMHKNNVLYFTSDGGGLTNEGAISKYDINTNNYSLLYSFSYSSGIGLSNPNIYPILDGNNIYGGCFTDNFFGNGGIYHYDISTNVFTEDTIFLGLEDGWQCNGQLVRGLNGMFYGMNRLGGNVVNTTFGNIFEFDPVNKTVHNVHSFNMIDGYRPNGDLIKLATGELIGCTESGGLFDKGVLFKYNPANNQYIKLHDFDTIAKNPIGQLILKGNVIFGTFIKNTSVFLSEGGVFMFDLNTNQMSIINLNQSQGVHPSGGLVNDGIKLIGLCGEGGKYNGGTVYVYDLNTNTKKDVYHFRRNTGSDIVSKGRLVKASNGRYFGTAKNLGISGGYGYIYEYNPISDTVVVKLNFDTVSIGSIVYLNPSPEMVLASDGNFYGICEAGETATISIGSPILKTAIFKYNYNTNDITILKNLYVGYSNAPTGDYFNGGMIEIGNTLEFLGTCRQGGVTYASCSLPGPSPGIVFKFNANSNNYSVLYDVSCKSEPYAYPSEATNMIYFNQDSIFLPTCGDNLSSSNYNRHGSIVHMKSNSNYYNWINTAQPFGNYQAFNSGGFVAKNKKLYLTSNDVFTSVSGNTYDFHSSFFEYNFYTNSLVKKFDFNNYNIFSVNGGLVEISDNSIISGQLVWPGDANSDGVADNLDVLELGLHYTQTGAPRVSTNNNWQSYFANNWTGTITNGSNLNHSDCNGDGTINNDDTLAIYNNYGLTHAFKPVQTYTVNPQLIIVPDQAAVVKGTWGTASVYLGDIASQINNINGVAFTVDFDHTLIEPNSIWIEYQNSFIDASQNLHFRKLDFTNSKLFTASTHTVSNNVSGFGKIATLHYQILSSLTTDQVLNIGLSQANQSNASGNITPLTTGTGTLMALVASVGIQENSFGSNILVSPNPTTGLLNISFNTIPQNTKIELYNSIGALVLTETMTNKNNTINASELSSGIYFMKVVGNNKVVAVKKVVRE